MSSSTSSPTEVIPWRRRPDLRVVPLEFEGRPAWGVKDPITLAYFELKDEEFFVLNKLDGQITSARICEDFGERFRPSTLSVAELQGFIFQLVSQGLLAANRPGYGAVLVARERAAEKRRRWSRLTNVLAIRFRGVDPDRFLGWLLTWLGWLFSPWAFGLGMLLIVCAVALVTVQFETLIHRLPDARAILTTTNLAWMAVLLGLVKILHELGHGLTCKRFGGECRELGLMFLVFTPTLYCNVSDVWMVRDKWKRIAVSCAGMWVEAVIASGCTLLWWFSAPGLFHSLCLNLMFICGVSTFLFNGNPLLRYDGYFVLADWLEIPNLQQQALSAVRVKLAGWYCFPDSPWDRESSSRRQWLLSLYGIASAIYRVALTVLILWSLHRWLQPMGLGLLVQVLAVLTIGLMFLAPLSAMVRYLRSPQVRDKVDWFRFRARVGMTIVVAAMLLSIPLPGRVVAGAILDQGEAKRVYVTLPGTLMSGAKVGDRVEAGAEVARLVHPDLEQERVRIDGEVRQHRIRLAHLERRRIAEPEAAQVIPSVREGLRDIEKQLAQLETSAERLVLRAPIAGLVLPPPRQSASVLPGTLPFWAGMPLDSRNQGCFLQVGTMVCMIGPSESHTALALISQDDINLVKVGQAVRFHWNELSGEVITGQIVEIAALDLDLLSHELISRLEIPARATSSGALRPIGAWYQARVKLDQTDAPLVRNSAGQAKIVIEPLSLGNRFIRWFSRTFPI